MPYQERHVEMSPAPALQKAGPARRGGVGLRLVVNIVMVAVGVGLGIGSFVTMAALTKVEAANGGHYVGLPPLPAAVYREAGRRTAPNTHMRH